MMTATKEREQKSMLRWIHCISAPTNIVSSPSDTTPDITMLADCVSSRFSPCSRGKAKTNGQIDDMLTPNRIPLRQQANSRCPAQMAISEMTPERTLALISSFSFSVLEPGTKAMPSLQTETMIQKMVGKTVAPLLSATPLSTAKEEIQPPQVHSLPMYRNIMRQRQSSIRKEAVLAFSFWEVWCSQATQPARSGDSMVATKGMTAAVASPSTTKTLVSKRQTMIGPSSPPIPKRPWVSSIQNSISFGLLIIRMQTLIMISIIEQPAPSRKSQTPSHNEESAPLNSQEKTPMVSALMMRMVWLSSLYFCSTLVTIAPVSMPKDRALKRQEYQVSTIPVSTLRQGMQGPSPLMQAPQVRKVIEQRMKCLRCLCDLNLSNICSSNFKSAKIHQLYYSHSQIGKRDPKKFVIYFITWRPQSRSSTWFQFDWMACFWAATSWREQCRMSHMTRAKKEMEQKSMLTLTHSISLPIIIVTIPSDTTPAMPMFVACLSSIVRPSSIGKVKISGKMENMLNPNRIALMQQANQVCPAQMMASETTPTTTLPSISILSFFLLLPGAQARQNRKRVRKTQKMLGNLMAPSWSVTPERTAKEGIQPPKAHSMPTQMKMSVPMQYSRVWEMTLAFILGDDFSKEANQFCSGVFILSMKGVRSRTTRPKTMKVLSSKKQTMMDEMMPPTPKAPCPIIIQYSVSSGGLMSRMETLRMTSKTEYPMLAMKSQTPIQKEDKVKEKRMLNSPTTRAPAAMRWRLLRFLL